MSDVLAIAKRAALDELRRAAEKNIAWMDDDADCPAFDDKGEVIGKYHQVRYDGEFDLDRLVAAILKVAAPTP